MTAATARAVATDSGLINDRFAAPLVRAVGARSASRVVDGALDLATLGVDAGFGRVAEFFAARTHYFDRFLADATHAGIRQAVILAAGLDARSHRLWWPPGTTLYEIDRPAVIAVKTATMRALGAESNVRRRAVGTELCRDWPMALQRAGFDATAPTVWLAEGLFIGVLTPDVQDRLLDDVTALSATGSRLAADYPAALSRSHAAHARALVRRWRKYGFNVDLAGWSHPGERNDIARYVSERNWETTKSSIVEVFAAAGCEQLSAADLDGAPSAISYLTATRR